MDKYPMFTLGELCYIEKGLTGIASAIPGEYPLVNTSAERKTCNTYQFDTEAVCIPLVSSTGHGKKSLNYVHYQQGKFALGTILAAVIPKDPQKLSASFLHRYLHFNKDRKIVPLMKGAANVSLAVKDIGKIQIPLPPITEQKAFIEIFNTVNDLSEKLKCEFSVQAACLAQLRQKIIQEAIAGELTLSWRLSHPVQRNNPDYDAVALLESIKEERKIKSDTSTNKEQSGNAPINPSEIKHKFPEVWTYARLGEVCEIERGGSPRPIQAYLTEDPQGLNWIKISDTDIDGKYITSTRQKIKHLGLSKTRKVFPGDFLLTNSMSYGRPYICMIEGCIHDGWLRIHPPAAIDKNYLYWFLSSPICQKYYDEKASGGTVQNLNTGKVKAGIMVLPSLAEQRQIVSRIESCLAFTKELETSIVERKKLVEDFLQVVLHENFGLTDVTK